MKYFLWSLCLAVISCNQPPASPTIVSTEKGEVEGAFNIDSTVRIFKGIPFAAPPVGELRWKAPQPAEPWEGVLPTNNFSASPIQNKPEPFYCWSEEFIAQPEPLSEDCLYLNVWSSASPKEKQPVFVWIYGGGLSSGSANCDIYDGEQMARQGVVFVSLNYRVGVLGFMAHPEMSAEAKSNVSGNYGFLDQIAALEWVRDNIEAFGGDPGNVTIAGQSAGAFSVNTLMASPLTEGLFHKAILQSGGLLSNRLQQNLEQAEQAGLQFMQTAGANSIEELRQLSAEKIQSVSNDSTVGRFGVTLEGHVLPVDLRTEFANGNYQQTPVMAGWVTGDGSFLGQSNQTVEQYKSEAEEEYGADAERFLEIFPAKTEAEVQRMKSKLTLLNFAGMTPHLLAGYNPNPTYVYEFAHVPVDKLNFPNYGAFHTSEVPFALHTLHTWDRPWRAVDQKVEQLMSNYWVNFAKTGNPNGEGLPQWNTYDKTSGAILKIDSTTEIKPEYLKKEFDFLEAQLVQ
ncbi:MAG: esterase [Pseudozobellia sp.]|nr:esterase [Pseudozobellia sp.]